MHMRMINYVHPYLTANWSTVFMLFVVTIISGCNTDKTRVTIENKGLNSLRSVTLIVTGNNYEMGDIRPRTSKSVLVSVTGESHVELSQMNANRLSLDVYLEPGYGGEVRATVTRDSVLSVKQDRNLIPFLRKKPLFKHNLAKLYFNHLFYRFSASYTVMGGILRHSHSLCTLPKAFRSGSSKCPDV